jgi:anaerobic selenocysteine-containing dehydrogenase
MANPLAKNTDEQIYRNACPRNCYGGCGLLSHVRDGRLVRVSGDSGHGFSRGKLCAKGLHYVQRVYSPDRLRYPLRQTPRGSGHWERVSWDEALEEIARKILDLKARYGSTLPIFLSKSTGNVGILHQAFDGFFGGIGHTTVTAGNLCWAAGIDARTFDFGECFNPDPEEIASARHLLIWGGNPAWTAVVQMPWIDQARENGAKVTVIDPVRTATASLADVHVTVRPGTDGALALGMARHLLKHGLWDRPFLAERVHGWEAFAEYLEAQIDPALVTRLTGVGEKQVAQLAEEYAAHRPAAIWAGMGLQRYSNGGQTMRAINALAAVTGQLGIPGGGVYFGSLQSYRFSYHIQSFRPPEGSQGVPGPDGRQTNRQVRITHLGEDLAALADPPVKMAWVACSNPFSQNPDQAALEETFRNLELVVQVDHFLNRTSHFADLVLPATTLFEQWDAVASHWHRWIAINEPAIAPYGESRSDLTIATNLSETMNRLSPGSSSFPTRGSALDWLRQEFGEGLLADLGIRDVTELRGGPRKLRMADPGTGARPFPTPSGRYELLSAEAVAFGHPALPEFRPPDEPSPAFPLRLVTSHSQFALHSQFQNLAPLMAANPEPRLEIHPKTAALRGIGDGDRVVVTGQVGFTTLRAALTRRVPEDVVLCYEAWYRGSDFCINDVVPPSDTDMGSKMSLGRGAASNECFVQVTRA